MHPMWHPKASTVQVKLQVCTHQSGATGGGLVVAQELGGNWRNCSKSVTSSKEKLVVERLAVEKSVVEKSAVERLAVERSAVEKLAVVKLYMLVMSISSCKFKC